MKNTAAENFVYFLTNTLIPDLKESGNTGTARDLTIAIKFIEGAKRSSGFTRDSFVKYLEKEEQDYRAAGREFMANDFLTARDLIHWDRG